MFKAIEDVDYNSNNIQSMAGYGEANIQVLTSSINKVMNSSEDFTYSFSRFSQSIYQINEITNIINGNKVDSSMLTNLELIAAK